MMSDRITLAVVVAVALGMAPAPPAAAHAETDERLAAVSAAIGLNPGSPDLHLHRAQLFSERGAWFEALQDLAEAERLDPDSPRIGVERGRILLEAGRPISARRALDQAVAAHPGYAEAWLGRGRLFLHLGERERAAADFEKAIALMADPRPEHYLEWASAAADDDAALHVLNEGLRRLGPVISLQVRALELEQKLGRTDAALARLDDILASAARREQWLLRRGEVLEAAGRRAEARRAYEEGLAALSSLTPFHRQTSATKNLQRRLESGLERTRNF